jgi:hypothetical protein
MKGQHQFYNQQNTVKDDGLGNLLQATHKIKT